MPEGITAEILFARLRKKVRLYCETADILYVSLSPVASFQKLDGKVWCAGTVKA